MSVAGKKVLVTGADGFIGSHLVERLVSEGARVRAFVQYNSFNSWGWLDESNVDVKKAIEVVAGDIRDPHGVRESVQGCDIVLHLAALIAIPYSYHSPDSYVDTNIRGTLNVVQAARQVGVERVVHTSTSEVYGTARFVPITEDHPLQGQSPYSASKIGADQIALSFFASFGTPVVVLRPFNTYGPRQSARAVIPTIICQLLSGETRLRLGALTPTRDFSYVSDTVSGFLAAAQTPLASGRVINLGSNFEVSVEDTARLIAQELGVPNLTLETELDRLRPPGSEVERLWADNSLAAALLRWRPEHAGVDGLRRGLAEPLPGFVTKIVTFAIDLERMSSNRGPAAVDSTKLKEAVVEAVRSVLGSPSTPIALHEPQFSGREWEYVKDCLDTGWVSTAGSYVERFEASLREVTGVPYVAATVNGTAALHISLILVGVKPGDEVLVPSLTFVATANAVAHAFAQPHFVDSETTSLGIDAAKLSIYLDKIVERRGGVCFNRKTGARIGALVVMHVFGHPSDLDALVAVADKWGIPLVEDAAESLGSTYRDRSLGGFGRVAALSFNGNKVVTTGGGGAILTRDAELGKRAKHITTTARKPHRWSFIHDEVGYNYRMPNLNAALGCAQMERLLPMLEGKRRLAERYRAAFSSVQGVRFIDEPPGTSSNFWLNSIVLTEPDVEARDLILEGLNAAGFAARPVWTLLHKLPMFAAAPRMDLATAVCLDASVVSLPSSARLGDALV